MELIVEGLATNYSLEGKGKLVVILHGWGDTSRGFHELQKELSTHFKVLAINLPGFGGSQAPTRAWDLTDFAGHVAALLAKLKLEPYVMMGHSNGGAILIRGLAMGALRSDKLVLLASAGIRGDKSTRKKALQLLVKGGKFLTRPLPAAAQRKLRQKTYQTIGSDMLLVENMQETFKKIVADDVRLDAKKLSLQTLLIYGDHDVATPLRYGRLLHEAIGGSKLSVIAGGGHFIHLDYSDEVINRIEEFIC